MHMRLFWFLQSVEELEKLTVDEHLSDIERSVYLLRWVLMACEIMLFRELCDFFLDIKEPSYDIYIRLLIRGI